MGTENKPTNPFFLVKLINQDEHTAARKLALTALDFNFGSKDLTPEVPNAIVNVGRQC